MSRIVGVIPARYNSSRLPGKPLKDIEGKPMIWWVYHRALKSKKLNELIVATDDARIVDACTQYGINTVMTGEHKTAAHRLHEVSTKIDGDYFIQINGDEPMIEYNLIDQVIPHEIKTDIEFGSNIITPINSPVELMDPSNIKVTFNMNNEMQYMSRNVIPYPYLTLNFKYYKHIGIIGYNKKMLDFYSKSTPGINEQIEGIDTLRFIDYGKILKVIVVNNVKSLSVDTEKDLEKVRIIIKEGESNE